MIEAQGFVIDGKGQLTLPQGVRPAMSIPTELVPYCPRCGKPLTMNLRADDTFVEDAGWQTASERYTAFLREAQHQRTLFLGWAQGTIRRPLSSTAFGGWSAGARRRFMLV